MGFGNLFNKEKREAAKTAKLEKEKTLLESQLKNKSLKKEIKGLKAKLKEKD